MLRLSARPSPPPPARPPRRRAVASAHLTVADAVSVSAAAHASLKAFFFGATAFFTLQWAALRRARGDRDEG